MPEQQGTFRPSVINSDWLMDSLPTFPRDNGDIAMSNFFQERLPSPGPSYGSGRNSQLMVRRGFTHSRCFASPTLGLSMGETSTFKSRIKQEASSSASFSFTSERMTPGPIPSPCLSYRSDHSMGVPPIFSLRSSYNSLLKDDFLKCFICKDVMKEPVSIPCGHSFCRTCICWEIANQKKCWCCPQCRKRFTAYPELNLNQALDGLLKQPGFSRAPPSQNYAGPEEMACDICSGKKLRAVKLCLTCSVAYCETHVRQHYTVEALQRHILTDVTEDLVKRTCQLHHRALEYFCKTDQQLICLDCVMQRHNGHDILLINVGSHEAYLHKILFCFKECRTEISDLYKHIEELTAKNKNLERAESELSHLSKRFCRGLKDPTDFTSEFVEVAALGRRVNLGMLYDCRSDSFRSDVILWEKTLISSMKLLIPRPQTDLRVLEKDTLQERLAALDLSVSLRASVVSGLVEMTGASAFINHPFQSELQDRITVHYRTSTRLDMISHDLLHHGFPLSMTDMTTATHVVVAVLYGSQAFFVLDKKKDKTVETVENAQLKDIVKKMISSSRQTDLISRLNEYHCAAYIDGDVLQSPLDSRILNPGVVPLKVWLYPLKNLHQTSACTVKDISEDQLCKAEEFLEKVNIDLNFCQHLMVVDGGHEIFTRFPALKKALSEFYSLLQQYQSNFQRRLASCIKTIRESGAEEEEEKLQDLLDRNNQSPFSPQCTHQWLQNKYSQIRALIQCKADNVDILNSQDDLQRFVQDHQADRVLCFSFTSLEGEDPFLSTLKQNSVSVNMTLTKETQQVFMISETSQKILSGLQLFMSNKKINEGTQETMFIAASVPDVNFSDFAIRLYQSGHLVSQNVQLDIKPDPLEMIAVQQTRVTMKLQSWKSSQTTEPYRVEYRTVSEDKSSVETKWRVIPCSEENCVVTGLVPGTRYEVRYALMDSNGMSDCSSITQFQTASRHRPGPPTVLKPNKESLYIAWQRAESDEDSPVLCYKVEYLDAGLEGWQSIQTDGPVCECTINLLHSNCYRFRVSAVYGNGDISIPSEETKFHVRVWTIDFSKRKASVFLEDLRLRKTKKSVKLQGCTDEESEVRSFLQCLSYISQLSIDPPQASKESLYDWRKKMALFLMKLCLQAAIYQKETIQETFHKLPSCYFKTYREQSSFLLDLYSCAKDYEIQTGQNVRPALQAVYQTLPKVWSINLSERKTSLFLEVLELQKVKKPVELRGWSKESETRILLRCLPYISQLSFIPLQQQREWRTRLRRYLLDLCLQAALHQKEMIKSIVEKCFKTDKEISVFLMLLYSNIRDYETQTGRSVLPALQEVFESFPKIWSLNLSDKKNGLFLEVLKLQTVKKAVEIKGFSEDENEMKIFLQCLPYISQLRFGFVLHGQKRKLSTLRFVVKLFAGVAELSAEKGESFTEVLASLCSFRTFSCNGDDQEYDNVAHCGLLLELYSHAKDYETETGMSVLPVLREVYESLPDVWTINLSDKNASIFLEVLKLQTVKKAVELTGWSREKRKTRSFFQCLPRISQLRLCSDVLVRMAQAKPVRSHAPVILHKLLLTEPRVHKPDETPCKILKSLAFILRHWEIQCLDLTEYKMAAQSLIGLLNHPELPTIRFSDDTLQKLVEVVYETQDENLTHCFLRTVGGDLTSCSLSWDVINHFLQYHTVTVESRRSTIKQENIQDLLPVLSKVHLRGLKSSFVLSIMRELYETCSAHSVSSLLSSTENCINLENRKLSLVDCAALRFTLEHCMGVSLNLLWTSIPEGELESIVPLLSHVSDLRVDRLLMLRLLHVPELHQEAAVVLSALHHKLDFSSHDALDLTADMTVNGLLLSVEDCRVISRAIQSAQTHIRLNVQDFEIEDAGVELLFPILHKVTLQCSKSVLLRFLILTEADHVRRVTSLAHALSDRMDLSETQLNPQACKALALFLEYSEGLSELDLSHCQLTDHALELLMPRLHKVCVLDLSHNLLTDVSAANIYNAVSSSNTQTVCLFNNRIADSSLFLTDQRFEIW
ncbi:uncharacterized protein LOC124381480 isoform X2 [Silurus meridionalis]|uniref:uncharacterized protein LOC124381480 isoform X2 n=1 Tax=Silurus meridionalis TaxID=175797 RepID=UPI001EEAE63C|nr:uncharacterized protein LOC124381480 isoform X2 [Silurus meridionalis]